MRRPRPLLGAHLTGRGPHLTGKGPLGCIRFAVGFDCKDIEYKYKCMMIQVLMIPPKYIHLQVQK